MAISLVGKRRVEVRSGHGLREIDEREDLEKVEKLLGRRVETRKVPGPWKDQNLRGEEEVVEDRGGDGHEGVGGSSVAAERRSRGAPREVARGAEGRRVLPSEVGTGGRGRGTDAGRSGSRGRRRNEFSLGEQNSGRQALRSRKGGALKNGIKARQPKLAVQKSR